MADIRDRSKRAENLGASWVLLAVYVQWPWLSWFVSHWGRLAERHSSLISFVAVMVVAMPASWFTARWIRRLPTDATVARIDTVTALTKERAAAIICGVATAPIIWSLVAAGVTDDLRTGTSLGSPYIFVNAALAGVAAALAVSAFILRNLRRLPVTPDRPVVPRWPPGWPPPPPS